MSNYKSIAEYYDLDQGSVPQEEIKFILDFIGQEGSRILEIGCGTGRLTLPLAKNGCDLWALDKEFEMIKHARQKSKHHLSATNHARIQWICADVNSLPFVTKFDGLLLGNNLFWEIGSWKRQQLALRHMREKLKKHGLLILDVFNPQTAQLNRLNGWVREIGIFQQKDCEVKLLGETTVDYAKQTILSKLKYKETNHFEKKEESYCGFVQQHYLFFDQLINVVKDSGYAVRAMYGSYFKEPLEVDSSPRILLILSN